MLYQNVKNTVDLKGFLEDSGFQFRKVGGGYRADCCPACGEGGRGSNRVGLHDFDRRWRCFSCGEGGDVIDAARLLWGCSMRQAAEQLAKEQAVPLTRLVAAPKKVAFDSQPALEEALARIQDGFAAGKPPAEAMRYLIKERGLPMNVLKQAHKQGMLRFLPTNPVEAYKALRDVVGQDLLIESGLLNPDKKFPAAAYRPLVFLLPGAKSAEFRLARAPREGERKAIRYGRTKCAWYWAGNPEKPLAVAEGAIDLLSLAALGYEGDIIGLPGASVWEPEWFSGSSRILLCLDNDKAGQDAAAAITRWCRENGMPVKNSPPPAGDVNKQLLLKREAA